MRRYSLEQGHVTEMEGHTGEVKSVDRSADGQVIASKGAVNDNSVRIWRADTGAALAHVRESSTHSWRPGLAFHPSAAALATLGDRETVIRIWDLDPEVMLGLPVPQDSVRYAAAKIVLLGESGVGKTGLGWRMAHGDFREHSSSHGQQFWLLDSLHAQRTDGTECEAVLWDLAGQPDYRLIHGLSLDDADLALLLCNPVDPSDPLRGVTHWLKLLAHKPGRPCRTILVGARCDRGDVAMTGEALEAFCQARGITGGYVRTSALTNEGIDSLVDRMKREVGWEEIPSTTTTSTFRRIKEFVLRLKADAARPGVLADWEKLRHMLEAADADWHFSEDELRTAVGHLAKHGYVRVLRTSEGRERLLLVPEVLNNLAASFVLEARRNPKGLGALEDARIHTNDYRFREVEDLEEDERQVLLDAATVLFVEHNIAFREAHRETSYLIFPELINEKRPLVDQTETIEDVSYTVAGAVENVYAALVVLLGYTTLFTRTAQWQDQAQYEVGEGEVCGFRQIAEREGEIDVVLYYGPGVSDDHRATFQSLVEGFLQRREVTVTRYPPLVCPDPKCSYRQERAEVVKRMRQGRHFLFCSECGQKVEMPKDGEDVAVRDADRRLVERERAAAETRTRFEAALTWVLSFVRKRDKEGKPPSCFISYAWGSLEHEAWVERRLARDLSGAGVEVILDRWHNAEFGSDVSRFVSRIDKSDAIVVVGTQLYLEKYEQAESAAESVLAAEMKLIGQRLLGTEQRAKTVRPLLLEGTPETSLPPLLRTGVRGDFRRDRDYFATLFDLILSVYGVPFDSPAVADLRESLRPGLESTRSL